MNSLSLLIYAVELISKVGFASGLFIFFGAVGFIAFTAIRVAIWMHTADDKMEDDDPTHEAMKTLKTWWKSAVIILCVSIFLKVALPSRETTIMIAASEVAEMVINTEQAQTVMKDVTGLGSDAVDLLKTYIQTEQKKLLESVTPEEKEDTNGNVKT